MGRTKADVRKEINRMSINALESLMANSDAARREKLQKKIYYLKVELESKDYLDVQLLKFSCSMNN